jgi:glutamyl-tRNA synthetase
MRFDDLVHGPIEFDGAELEDFVILRSDGHPTYHLSVVSDDVEMRITHVVRGDDHISNTPKQLLLYRAVGAPIPQFAHVPLILGPDKKRLSKRHGATSVGEYQAQGVLPEAMVNFLALLGWSPGAGDREVFSRDELVARFTLEGISGGDAVFNPEKLEWFNQQHIARLDAAAILALIEGDLARDGLAVAGMDAAERRRIERVVELVKPRVRRLSDFAAQVRPFLSDSIERDPAAADRYLSGDVAPHLSAWREELARAESFDAASLEARLRALAAARGIKPAALIHATRVAVTGQAVSPGLFDVLELMGRARVMRRLEEVA